MGFAVAYVIAPQTGAQSSLIGQYFYIIALLFLLSVNGHHVIIDGIFNSYEWIPIDEFISFGGNFSQFIIQTFSYMFLIAFQMALPLVCFFFSVAVAFGLFC